MVLAMQAREISSLEVTKNIALISEEKKNNKVVNLKLEKPEDKPLVVMLSWLMARKKHIHKYANIYLKHGFDVLNISVTPMQLLWPTKGTQVIIKWQLGFGRVYFITYKIYHNFFFSDDKICWLERSSNDKSDVNLF